MKFVSMSETERSMRTTLLRIQSFWFLDFLFVKREENQRIKLFEIFIMMRMIRKQMFVDYFAELLEAKFVGFRALADACSMGLCSNFAGENNPNAKFVT